MLTGTNDLGVFVKRPSMVLQEGIGVFQVKEVRGHKPGCVKDCPCQPGEAGASDV
jgi:hypothetical protein